MFCMAKLTREEVVKRGESAFMIAGYYYGGDYWSNPFHVKYVPQNSGHTNPFSGAKNYTSVPCSPTESPYIACDCAAFTGWCWGIEPANVWSGSFTTGGTFGANFRRRKYTGDITVDFAGIQAGDVLWRNKHVALFCGNYTLELSTSDWPSTTNGHGGNRKGLERLLAFDGYCSYDGSFSTDFTPSVEDYETFTPAGSTDQGSHPPDMSSDLSMWYPYNIQYTKRYVLRKSARRY